MSLSTSTVGELYPNLGVMVVKVTGLESDKGVVVASLFDKKSRWMKAERAYTIKKVPAKLGSVEFEMEAPIRRRYALSVYHDENENGKLDTGFPIPKPTEPVGASNFSGNSIPRYYECSFRFQQEPLEISVQLRRP